MGGKSSKKKVKRPTILSILAIGNSMAGKTALINCYKGMKFDPSAVSTIANEFELFHKVLKDDKNEVAKVKIKMWDSPGQERFESIVVNALQNTQGIFLVYDTTNKQSFNDLQTWINRVNKYKDISSFPFILIANKIDLVNERQISQEECKEFAEKNKMPYFETSAKSGQGVKEAINSLISRVFNANTQEPSSTFVVTN